MVIISGLQTKSKHVLALLHGQSGDGGVEKVVLAEITLRASLWTFVEAPVRQQNQTVQALWSVVVKEEGESFRNQKTIILYSLNGTVVAEDLGTGGRDDAPALLVQQHLTASQGQERPRQDRLQVAHKDEAEVGAAGEAAAQRKGRLKLRPGERLGHCWHWNFSFFSFSNLRRGLNSTALHRPRVVEVVGKEKGIHRPAAHQPHRAVGGAVGAKEDDPVSIGVSGRRGGRGEVLDGRR